MIFNFFILLDCSYTFYCYFNDQQTIKTLNQIKPDYLTIHNAFVTEPTELTDSEIIRDISNYDVFILRDNGELVAGVYLKKTIYYKKMNILPPFTTHFCKEIDAVEIFSLFVNETYRKKGLSRVMLCIALQAVKAYYKLPNDFIVGLHLNESDKYMNISFALYYSMNFRKGAFVQNGPSSYSLQYNKVKYFINPLDLVSEYKDGIYFAMYAKYCDLLLYNKIVDKKLYDIGEELRKELKARKIREELNM